MKRLKNGIRISETGKELLIGNVLFFASDIILSISMFFKDFKRRDFYIMSTYLAAQTLMSLGLLFMLG